MRPRRARTSRCLPPTRTPQQGPRLSRVARSSSGRAFASRSSAPRRPARMPGITITSPASSRSGPSSRPFARRWIRRRREHADVVVVVLHTGLNEPSSYDTVATRLPSENVAAEVARQVPGIDLIVYGHSHKQMADTLIAGVAPHAAEELGAERRGGRASSRERRGHVARREQAIAARAGGWPRRECIRASRGIGWCTRRHARTWRRSSAAPTWRGAPTPAA